MTASPSDDALCERVLAMPLMAATCPGIGGVLRARPEDFEVDELPAYAPDGRGNAHVLVQLGKRGISTEDAVREVARQLSLSRPEIGVAGKKDRDAVTRQWISIAAHAAPTLPTFRHEAITLGPGHAHGNKLRIGHLTGNRFTLVIRDPIVGYDEAAARVRASLSTLATAGGMLNAYGPQRFGRGASDVARGLSEVRRGRGGRRGNMVIAGGQAALFNLYLAERIKRGLLHTVLQGEMLKKRDTGGLFWSDDPKADQARLDARQVEITGPIYGSKMRAPPPETAAADLELAVLQHAEIEPASLRRLGRAAMGTRRPIRVQPEAIEVAPADAVADLPAGITVRFVLPPGAYATVLMQELMAPTHAPLPTGA